METSDSQDQECLRQIAEGGEARRQGVASLYESYRLKFPIMCCIKSLIVIVVVATGIHDAGAAESHAILVGVSAYDNLPRYQQLRGPANDVGLIRDLLSNRGFDNDKITVLADNVVDGTRPTRAAILGAFDALLKKLEPGDFVFLFFAGHGSQQPAGNDSREPDGLDEIFLPIDIGKWVSETATVENAITDNEIGRRVTAMRNRGAFVWAVFDTCHSGTMTRALPVEGERLRNVDPVAELGVPMDRIAGLADQPDTSPDYEIEPIGEDSGGLVAFYASQSLERTPEMYLPPGDATSQPHGLFTYNLVEVLTRYENISYRQAGQQVLRNYTVLNRHRPTPVIEGSHLDAPVFGISGSGRLAQWPLQRIGSNLELAAGRLHLLEPGAVLAVLPNPASTDEDTLGFVEIARAELTRSKVTGVDYAGHTSIKLSEIPSTAYGRLVEPRFNFRLRVAIPESANSDETPPVIALLAGLAGDKRLRTRLEIVEPGKDADVYAVEHDGRLLLLPASVHDVSQWNGPAIDLDKPVAEIRADLVLSLSRIGKVLNLLRLTQHISDKQLPVRLETGLQRRDSDDVALLPVQSVPILRDGDKLNFRIENHDYRPVDVTILFIDSAYRLSLVYPREIGELNRIEPRGSDVVHGVVDTSQSFGRENLLMLAVAADANAVPTDFSFLVQDTPFLEADERGGGSELSFLLRDAGFMDGGTRGFSRVKSTDLKNASMMLLSWYTEADIQE